MADRRLPTNTPDDPRQAAVVVRRFVQMTSEVVNDLIESGQLVPGSGGSPWTVAPAADAGADLIAARVFAYRGSAQGQVGF